MDFDMDGHGFDTPETGAQQAGIFHKGFKCKIQTREGRGSAGFFSITHPNFKRFERELNL